MELQLAGIEFGGMTEAAGPLVLPGIHDEVVAVMRAAGYDTIDKIIEAGADGLGTLQGFDAETVDAVLATAESERAARDAAAAAAPAPVADEDDAGLSADADAPPDTEGENAAAPGENDENDASAVTGPDRKDQE